MSIGTTIKRLRKDKDITQEQLSEYLNVSPQAISQWECGKSAPDISQIPLLTRILGVSADTLLEIECGKEEHEVAEFLKEYDRLGNIGDRGQKFDLTRRMYEKYPCNFQVMIKYARELFNDPAHMEEPLGEEVHKDEIRRICELIIRDCTEQKFRYDAYDMLGAICLNEGDVKGAKEICAYFPESYFDIKSEQIEQLYARTDDKMYVMQMRKNIMDTADHLVAKMRNLGTFGAADERERCAVYKKCLALLGIIFDDEERGFAVYHLGELHCRIARSMFRTGDFPEALEHMEEGLRLSKKYDDEIVYTSVRHTSLLLCGVEEDLSQIDAASRENAVSYEISEFKKMENERDLPEEYFGVIKKYAPFAKNK